MKPTQSPISDSQQDLFRSGLTSKLNISFAENKKIDFSYELKLNGSDYLHFMPVGKETKVSLASSWPHPDFHGNFLPLTSTRRFGPEAL